MAMSGDDALDFSDNAAMGAVKTMLGEASDVSLAAKVGAADSADVSGGANGSDGISTATSAQTHASSSHALLVAGAPGSGKTEFALAATLEGIARFGDAKVFMAVSGRQAADKLSDRIIRSVGSTSSARPVTTLSAIAFRLLSAVRASHNEPLPKLLNGAEQDALLRQVVAVHVRHAQTGELCDTCELMRQYFATDDWVNTIYGDDGTGAGNVSRASSAAAGQMPSVSVSGVQPRTTSKGIGSSDVLFARGVNDAFVMQLRDMLARMDELGLGAEREDEVLAMLRDVGDDENGHSLRAERLGVQWRLAFALRREYAQTVVRAYPGEFRLDSSRLLVEGAQAAAQVGKSTLPNFVVVDDFQDLTLAGLAFLEALARRQVKLLLVGNPDEAVQTFRGSYPEYLFTRAQQAPLSAELMTLPARRIRKAADIPDDLADGVVKKQHSETAKNRGDHVSENDAIAGSSYLDLLASRVSLSIAANEETSVALPNRPGKLPRITGSLPIDALDVNDPELQDGSVKTALYRTSREELDDVVWRIKEAHLSAGRQWNDMALIAHDNDTVRAFGERLRRDGVPVRYSAVTKPLKDDPSVQGLFALLELARLRRDGIDACKMSLGETARYVCGRVQTLLESPLVGVRQSSSSGVSGSSPARLAPVEAVMKAIASLAQVVDGEMTGQSVSTDVDKGSDGNEPALDVTAQLPRLQAAWERLRQRFIDNRPKNDVEVDDSLLESGSVQDESDMPFGVDAMYIMLAFGDTGHVADSAGDDDASEQKVDSAGTDASESDDDAAAVLALIGKVGRDLYTRAFAHVWDLVSKVTQGMSALPSAEPQYALGLAWDACHVSNAWQRQALANNDDGRAANDRLDVMMRLFAYASGSGAKQSVEDFIASVRSMRIEADSLAKVAPIDQAVTLSTPAGAAGGHWPLVFITAIQQDVWPNLAARNTMFGGENLADIVLHGKMCDEREPGVAGTDPELAQVLSAEQKSFLVALTRASERVTLSAVLSDDAVPSDFLYTYVPERFDRVRDAAVETRDYAQLADSGRFAGLDTDPRGLVAASRIELMRQADAMQCGRGNAGDVIDVEGDSRQSNSGLDAMSSARARDAAVSLALLDDAGLSAADPDGWPYTFGVANNRDVIDGDDNAASREATSTFTGQDSRQAGLSDQLDSRMPSLSNRDDSLASSVPATPSVSRRDNQAMMSPAPTVTLSPSQVDRIWGCPVCWMLESQFAGPRPSSAATSFGTIIHEVAQQASEVGLDRPDFMAGSSEEERIAEISSRMMDMYHNLADDSSAIDDPKQRYQAEAKDEGAERTLNNIATYFVMSNGKDYPDGNLKNFAVGGFERADCEHEFAALFGLEDIRAAYNAIEGVDPIDVDELYAIMGVLNGGWPEGMQAGLQIRLTGRIDRMEWRSSSDGKEHVRLIDWKTGHTHNGRQMFNDLQLVCYQLGLAFPEPRSARQDDGSDSPAAPNVGLRGVDAIKAMPDITQSALFDVDSSTAPAQSYGAAENLFQPPLFRSGSLNSTAFTPRSHIKTPKSLLDIPPLPQDAPEGVGTRAWEQFLALRGTQAVWALTMIARIFYAAAASRSRTLVARPQPDHLTWCRMKRNGSNIVCPACAGEVDTVYEVRRA
ncbi:PD-(D/E)XK nuclease family protein [Bifidobacterium sp. ESL0775]|uniref:PD-(D/E)XK nuclease family protein n=1 Tax=Bifidobacterium sp. ESL0775 TaxID=2983230 RepID=UPI0023F6A3AF|nr:PD-(D/E)XK nuclease family protein [Bifidobacterium sp. ESL0775]WEV69690.1 PD-(D/E)XK nuclease family protein [Bifidobacterium sp. ESL0775]